MLPLFVLILNQSNPVRVLPSYLLNTHFTVVLPSTPRSSKWPPSLGLPHQHRVRKTVSPLYAPHAPSILDAMNCTIFGEVYKSHSSSLCSLIQSTVASSPLSPNIFLSILQFLLRVHLNCTLLARPQSAISDTQDTATSNISELWDVYFVCPYSCLTLLWYHGVYVTPVLFDSRFFLNCHEYWHRLLRIFA